MKKENGGIRIKVALLLIGLVPMLILALSLSTYSCITIVNELKSETYNKLEVAAEQVNAYFAYDLEMFGGITYDDYSDHAFIESQQKLNVEMTLFEKNIRFLTSLKKDDGTYNEGSKAGEGIWETVSKGEKYTSDDTVIGGQAYYVCYVPIYDVDGSVWGMGFAGTKQEGVNSVQNAAILRTILITVAILAVCTAIIIYLANKIYKSMFASAETLTTLATGTMNVNTDYVSKIHEIKQIIDATDNLKIQLSESVGGAKNTAVDLNDAVMSVDNLAKKSADDTNAITHSMEELAVTAQSLAETVQDANSSVIDMGEAISSISDKAQVSASDAEDMRSVNKQVADVIANVKASNEKSVEAIRQIGILTGECKQAVEAIKTAADEITGIAGQTNLLALNASIESARAGEAGRGFSVVAENIKNLATESANSSAGISQRVNDIISRVDRCVEAAEAASAIMQEQNSFVEEAGESMDRLSASVGSVADNISVITDEAKRLDEVKVKVLNNISDLSAISEENAASSEQVSASVDEVSSALEGVREEADRMRGLAAQLEEKMEFFKL